MPRTLPLPAPLAARRGPGPLARGLPEWLDRDSLARLHGPALGRLVLWRNRARARHALSRLATEATPDRLRDLGLDRARIAREAARRFWQEMDPR